MAVIWLSAELRSLSFVGPYLGRDISEERGGWRREERGGRREERGGGRKREEGRRGREKGGGRREEGGKRREEKGGERGEEEEEGYYTFVCV